MTVQANSEANFEAKYFSFKWNLQRAEKYVRLFVLVILAFSLTVCGLIVNYPGYEESFAIPAMITIGIYFAVFLYGFFSEVDFTDWKVIYSIQVPISSLIPVWCILLAVCHIYLSGSIALSYTLLAFYINICFLLLVFLVTVVQLQEVHMFALLRFVVQFISIIELYGFVWIGNLMKEMIQSGEIPM